MYSDGSISKEGDGASIWIISPNRDYKVYSFKLTFECKNYIAEYEALLLELDSLKELKEKRIDVFGASELVVNQVNNSYQTKHPRTRAYRNEVSDMLENLFVEHRVTEIPRMQNQVADSLATTAGNFKVRIYYKKKYKLDIVNRPSILDNSMY